MTYFKREAVVMIVFLLALIVEGFVAAVILAPLFVSR
jgi:hypothetical protein